MALNALQLEAAELLARGNSPHDVRDFLQLSLSSFETWRADPLFVRAVDDARTSFGGDALTGRALAEANAAFGTGTAAPILTPNDSKETYHDPAATR